MAKTEAKELRLIIDPDDSVLLGNGDGQRWRLQVGASGVVNVRPLGEESPAPAKRELPSWRCERCDNFWTRPDRTVAIANHLTRVHALDAEKDGAAIDAAKARARELLKDPRWVEQLKLEKRRAELIREADQRLIDGLRASYRQEYDEARKLYAKAHRLRDEAKAL